MSFMHVCKENEFGMSDSLSISCGVTKILNIKSFKKSYIMSLYFLIFIAIEPKYGHKSLSNPKSCVIENYI